jgi:hypothetical protein
MPPARRPQHGHEETEAERAAREAKAREVEQQEAAARAEAEDAPQAQDDDAAAIEETREAAGEHADPSSPDAPPAPTAAELQAELDAPTEADGSLTKAAERRAANRDQGIPAGAREEV